MHQKGCDFIYLRCKIVIMKLIVSLSILVLFASCGKYEKPFITFKSPEERLTGTEWECIKAVDVDGVEFEVNDRVQFSIDGVDSTFTRISNYNPLTGLNQTNKMIQLLDLGLGHMRSKGILINK